MGAREEHVQLRDAHVPRVDHADALRGVHRHHRAPHVQHPGPGIDGQQSRGLERGPADQLVGGVEAQDVPAADQRHVPVGTVPIHRRVMGTRVAVEPVPGHVDGGHHLAGPGVEDRHAGRSLVGDVDPLGLLRPRHAACLDSAPGPCGCPTAEKEEPEHPSSIHHHASCCWIPVACALAVRVSVRIHPPTATTPASVAASSPRTAPLPRTSPRRCPT